MPSYKDLTDGISPKCPHCNEEANFVVAIDEHTVGEHGAYEIVCCKKCHKVIHMQCFPKPL